MSLVLNILLLIFGIVGCYVELKDKGRVAFKYYTFESNLLGTIAAAIMVVFLILERFAGVDFTACMMTAKYIATCSLTLTLFIVISVLAPMSGKGGLFKLLFTEAMLYQHTICPVLAIITFLVVDPKFDMPLWITALSILVTLIYALVLVILIIKNQVSPPYPFLEIKKQSLKESVFWFTVILLIDYALILALWWLY